ncbi:MAG TPA: SLC26A/SulP transporter family protein [Bacteroidia bacterium]|nr:SLC26A/SulP transporter family protein [Bacteroidia bacterium]
MDTQAAQKKTSSNTLVGDLFGGFAAMLVALPSAIAFGLLIYAPLGAAYSGRAAIGGIMGTIVIGILAALFGGTKRLISAPCAPAAAVLSVFMAEQFSKGAQAPEMLPVYLMLIGAIVGLIQILLGKLGGGTFIKYIPYPVVAGYLSGVGVLIFIGQVPKWLGLPKDLKLWHGLFSPADWKWESIVIGAVTIAIMYIAPRIIKLIPAAIVSLAGGIVTYFILSVSNPALLQLEGNPLIIGPISASLSDLGAVFSTQWSMLSSVKISQLGFILAPALTLAVLLSIDTLKTCVVLDAITYSRHDSNKELVGQGTGNIGSALLCGIPGAGTMGATLVNLNSGGKTKASGLIYGVCALLVLLLFGRLVAWIPIASLAGILIVVAVRMVDFHTVSLLKHKSTAFDFFVVLGVIITAVAFSLIAAAGVGILLAIILFLREQMRTSVIRRKMLGNQVYSKKSRVLAEREILSRQGQHTLIIELQGQLFFGTADQLLSKIEPYLSDCRYVLLDMRRVQSIDYTAVNRIKQILGRIKDQKGYLIFSSVPLSLPSGLNVKEYLLHLGLTETDNLKFFDNLDFAMEWVEDEILTEARIKDDERVLALKEIELFNAFPDKVLQTLSNCLIEKQYTRNELVFKMKEEGDEIYFIKKGNIKILLPVPGGGSLHLATISKGDFFGDMAFLDKRARSADAMAGEEVSLYILSRKKFNEISAQYPDISGQFFEKLAFVISNRLRLANMEINALQEN